MTSPLFRSGGAFRRSSSMAPHRRKASSIAPAKPALDETVANSRAERCHARRVIERGMHITGAERGTSDAWVRAPGWAIKGRRYEGAGKVDSEPTGHGGALR